MQSVLFSSNKSTYFLTGLVFIVNFEYISYLFLVFLVLVLNNKMLSGYNQ